MEYETFGDVAASLPRFIEDVYNVPSVPTRRSDTKVLLNLKRNTPGSRQFNGLKLAHAKGVHSRKEKIMTHLAWDKMTDQQKFDFLHEWCDRISRAVQHEQAISESLHERLRRVEVKLAGTS